MRRENSSQNRLKVLVNKTKKGRLLFPGDYFDIGSPEAIHMAFSRLAKQKELVRLGKGIYLKPKSDPLLGQLRPSLEEIARKIAEKEKVVIRPTGSYALNKLGLSTQVPTKVVFLTNGNSRIIRIGKGTITFKRTTPKKLAAKNDIVFLAIQALIELGGKNIPVKVIQKLSTILERVRPAAIRADAKLAPNEVAKTLYLIAGKIEHDGRIFAVAGRSATSNHRAGKRQNRIKRKSD